MMDHANSKEIIFSSDNLMNFFKSTGSEVKFPFEVLRLSVTRKQENHLGCVVKSPLTVTLNCFKEAVMYTTQCTGSPILS